MAKPVARPPFRLSALLETMRQVGQIINQTYPLLKQYVDAVEGSTSSLRATLTLDPPDGSGEAASPAGFPAPPPPPVRVGGVDRSGQATASKAHRQAYNALVAEHPQSRVAFYSGGATSTPWSKDGSTPQRRFLGSVALSQVPTYSSLRGFGPLLAKLALAEKHPLSEKHPLHVQVLAGPGHFGRPLWEGTLSVDNPVALRENDAFEHGRVVGHSPYLVPQSIVWRDEQSDGLVDEGQPRRLLVVDQSDPTVFLLDEPVDQVIELRDVANIIWKKCSLPRKRVVKVAIQTSRWNVTEAMLEIDPSAP